MGYINFILDSILTANIGPDTQIDKYCENNYHLLKTDRSNELSKYIKQRMVHYNSMLFHNRLTPCEVYISDNRHLVEKNYCACFMHIQDPESCVNIPMKCCYVFSRGIFARKDFADTVIIHEMCHQAVFEIDKHKATSRADIHGPNWKAWMNKVGLFPAERYEFGTDINKIPYYKELDIVQLMNEVNRKNKELGCPNTSIELSYADSNLPNLVQPYKYTKRDNSIKVNQCKPDTQAKKKAVEDFIEIALEVAKRLPTNTNPRKIAQTIVDFVAIHPDGFKKIISTPGLASIAKELKKEPEFNDLLKEEKKTRFKE